VKLTKAQQKLVDRAFKRENRNGDPMFAVYNHRAFDWPTEAYICDLFGSAQIRCAYRLQEMGYGRVVSIQPLERSFFKLYLLTEATQ